MENNYQIVSDITKINKNTRITNDIFSIRTTNCLIGSGIATIGQLIEKRDDDLMTIKHFGVTCLNEVKKIIKNNIDGLPAAEYTGFTSKGTMVSPSLLLGPKIKIINVINIRNKYESC